MSRRRTSALLVLTALAAAPVLAACGGSAATGAPAGSGSPVRVLAGDDSCEVGRTYLDAGSTTFEVTNTGSQVTEVYVYGADGEAFTKVVSEVENIGPGTSRDMVVDLVGGTYEVACKPGQSGDGIRTTITIAGATTGDSESERG